MSFRDLLDELKYFRGLHSKQEGWYSELLMRVLSGKSLREIAASYNCNYSPLREFIREDDERESAYQEVLEKKKQDHADELLDRVLALDAKPLQVLAGLVHRFAEPIQVQVRLPCHV